MDVVPSRDGVHFLHSAFPCKDFAVLPVRLRRELLGGTLLDSHLFFRYNVRPTRRANPRTSASDRAGVLYT